MGIFKKKRGVGSKDKRPVREKINEGIKGLLGDFPEAFNAGYVYGTPGMVGDTAYMGEILKGPFTGSVTPPEQYPGTSEYIASKAGYEVPESLSGNLGWIGGQILAPGPGEAVALTKGVGLLGNALPAMLLGAKAKTAKPSILKMAKEMEKAGATRDEIWNATFEAGQPWFRDVDGEWKFEISDKDAVFTNPLDLSPEKVKGADLDAEDSWPKPLDLSDILSHPELEKAYFPTRETEPNIWLSRGRHRGMFREGATGSPDEIYLNTDYLFDSAMKQSDDPKRTLLHELDHKIQKEENFGRGGNPRGPYMPGDRDEYVSILKREIANNPANKDASPQQISEHAEWIADSEVGREFYYKRLLGEANARTTASSADMSMEDRGMLPFYYRRAQDTPDDQLIVRKGMMGDAAAIPFFHGSPHKYEVPSLDKIGTGEGAQAYGWGYYGAEREGTARDYSRKLSQERNWSTSDLIEDGRMRVDPETEQYISIGPNNESKAFWNENDAKEWAQEGLENLYRGEYRWPDPAKEAATPLTGEDMLDYDALLSEQPEHIKKKLEPLINYWRELGASEDAINTWRGEQLYDNAGFVGAKMGIQGADRQQVASKYLSELGIPGIRYQDQLSRGSKGGTYNYVMFDDKGITLLERNGKKIGMLEEPTANRAERARGMGFDPDVTWYHGTKGDIEEFDANLLGSKTKAKSAKEGVFMASNPEVASGYAETGPNVIISKWKKKAEEHFEKSRSKQIQELNKLRSQAQDVGSFRPAWGTPEYDKWQKDNKPLFDRLRSLEAKHQADWEKYWSSILSPLQEKAWSGENVMPLHVRMKNPYIYDYRGQPFRDVSYAEIVAKAKSEGHDGVILRNTYDPAKTPSFEEEPQLTDIAVVFDPQNIKSKWAKFKKKGRGMLD